VVLTDDRWNSFDPERFRPAKVQIALSDTKKINISDLK